MPRPAEWTQRRAYAWRSRKQQEGKQPEMRRQRVSWDLRVGSRMITGNFDFQGKNRGWQIGEQSKEDSSLRPDDGFAERAFEERENTKEAKRGAYFFWSARVRISLAAVLRSVSGTFLFMLSFLRSTALRRGSMWRETSRGVFALFRRLRTTA